MSPIMSVWFDSAAAWLTPQRLRAQAFVLAVCLWGVCAVDFATAGPFDRFGNIKFQDFLPIYTAARLISQGHAAEIYDDQRMAGEMRRIIGESASEPMRARLPYLYGPQVGSLFAPLAKIPFAVAGRIWAATGLAIYFGCLLLLWKLGATFLASFARSGAFRERSLTLFTLAAAAYPPLFHCFVRGQNSALVMACFTAAYLAFNKQNEWLGGVALGLLIFKPQFLVAIPLVLLLSFAWKALVGLMFSAAAQLALAWLYFGTAVMRIYADMLLHVTRFLNAAELSQAEIQMHSLRAFWSLLIPWPQAAFALYIVSAIVVVVLAASIWKSSSPLALRFAALTLAAVLVNPHLFIYDLLALGPALLLLAHWVVENRLVENRRDRHASAVLVLSYLAFMLPLFGPLSRWTHLQLSVPVFFALLWTLWSCSRASNETAGHKLASSESRVV
jgi:alpha-1,2-mannosyltransferase